MNKILQGILVLDSETSRELKKGGIVTLEVEGNHVEAHLNENKELSFNCSKINKEVKVEHYKEDTIYLKNETYNRLMNGERVLTTKGFLYKDENGKFIVETEKQTKIDFVVYR